jgi:hypothetical protein
MKASRRTARAQIASGLFIGILFFAWISLLTSKGFRNPVVPRMKPVPLSDSDRDAIRLRVDSRSLDPVVSFEQDESGFVIARTEHYRNADLVRVRTFRLKKQNKPYAPLPDFSPCPALCPGRAENAERSSRVIPFPPRSPRPEFRLCSTASQGLRTHLTSCSRACQPSRQ